MVQYHSLAMTSRGLDRCLVVIVFMVSIIGPESYGQLLVPGLDYRAYAKEGDINIGSLASVYRYSASSFCSDEYSPSGAQSTELAAHMTETINNNDALLPNITLGFVVMDDCHKGTTALARSLYFVPSEHEVGSSGSIHYPVVGVVGPIYSSQSVMISSFLGLFQIPVLATYATSGELSDKSRFPYFMRLVPPDDVQALTIMEIVLYFKWSYISILYSEGSYGENGAKQIEKLVNQHDVCLAVSQRLLSDYGDKEIEKIVRALRSNKEAPVVILFLETFDFNKLFGYLTSNNITSGFQWISGDNFAACNCEVAQGAIYVYHPRGTVPGFADHIRAMSRHNDTNPWLPLLFESGYQCSLDTQMTTFVGNASDSSSNSCESYESLANVRVRSNPFKSADGFMVYANALHSLISDHCPHLFRKDAPRNFSKCIKGPLLLEYMKNVSFEGFSGKIIFDDKGDLQGRYTIQQYHTSDTGSSYALTVGEWDKLRNSLYLNMTKLDWGGARNLAKMELKSICSVPCAIGHYYQPKEVSCCWECVKCRDNEITVNNLTDCEPCPDFKWPDNDTKTTCEEIIPKYLHSSDPIGICLLSLAASGALISIGIIVVYFTHPNNRLLKATSRELSISILIGCMLGCLGSMLFITYPDRVSCPLREASFHLVVCIMYSPLLIKTSRVFRIFSAGKRGSGRPKLISNKIQILFTILLIIVQALLLLIVELRYPTVSKLLIPFPLQPYAELDCLVDLLSFLIPLCYNMLLLVTCSVLGYLTKALPENFNDSRYIFVSISTTLFMWIVFLPTYFTTFHSYHKAALLDICLLLNSYITMLCQFGPKVYAVFFARESDMTFNTMGTSNSVSVVKQTSQTDSI